MHPVFKAVCSAVIILEVIVNLWLVKLLGDVDGINSFTDGIHAVINCITSGW